MKKTIAIVSVVFLALLVAVTVILAVIPKTFYDPISNYQDLSFIRVYKGDGTSQDYMKNSIDEESKEVYSKLLELHEKSLKQNLLVALFEGALSFDGGIVTEAYNADTMKEEFSKNCYLDFTYNGGAVQTLKYDGKEFRNGEGDLVEYTKIVLEVFPKDYMEECRAFIINEAKASAYNITFLAHQSELYQYIQGLDLLNTVSE